MHVMRGRKFGSRKEEKGNRDDSDIATGVRNGVSSSCSWSRIYVQLRIPNGHHHEN